MGGTLIPAHAAVRKQLLGKTGVSDGTRTRDILDHNWRQRGPMEVHALARSLMGSDVLRWGLHGCGTSLLYKLSRSQSLGKPCVVVYRRRITCADAVATLAHDGCRRRSLLHGCYMVDLGAG